MAGFKGTPQQPASGSTVRPLQRDGRTLSKDVGPSSIVVRVICSWVLHLLLVSFGEVFLKFLVGGVGDVFEVAACKGVSVCLQE